MYELTIQSFNITSHILQSDFSILGERYDRDTRSMTTLKNQIENVDQTIKMLKSTTLSSQAEDVYPRYLLLCVEVFEKLSSFFHS